MPVVTKEPVLSWGNGALKLNVHFLSVSDGGLQPGDTGPVGRGGQGGGLQVDKPEYQWELFPSVGSLTEPQLPGCEKGTGAPST